MLLDKGLAEGQGAVSTSMSSSDDTDPEMPELIDVSDPAIYLAPMEVSEPAIDVAPVSEPSSAFTYDEQQEFVPPSRCRRLCLRLCLRCA